jgi:hypothetical protein
MDAFDNDPLTIIRETEFSLPVLREPRSLSEGMSKMRNRVTIAVATTLLMMLILSSRARPQSAAPAKTGTGMEHDLSGVWNPRNIAAPKLGSAFTPAGQAQFDFNTHELKEGRPITIDPTYTCHPPGLPHAYFNSSHPFEMIQTPQRIFIFHEGYHVWREVWMDGREMPKDSDPLWMGYSIGHWDGDDLVVETASFNDKTWLDSAGHPHSDAFKLTERFHRVDHDRLQVSFKIDDPKVYTATWGWQTDFDLKPKWELGEDFCIPENQKNYFERELGKSNGGSTPAK